MPSVLELPFYGFQGLEGPGKVLRCTLQIGAGTTSESGQLAEGKCFRQSNLNFFCCEPKAYFA